MDFNIEIYTALHVKCHDKGSTQTSKILDCLNKNEYCYLHIQYFDVLYSVALPWIS
jgi:hypothetical protein